MSHAHVHSHGSSGRTPRAGRTLRTVVVAILIAAGLATAAGLALLWPDSGTVAEARSGIQFAAPGTTFPTGRITALSKDCPGYFSSDAGSAPSPQPGDTRVCRMASVELLSGKSQGETVSVPLLWPWATAGRTWGMNWSWWCRRR